MRTNFKYALFYDFHTPVTVPGVLKEFDVEGFTDQLVRCKVDFLTWHARCNQGGAYYPTKIGIPHPGLDYDFFGKLAEACKRKNIRLSAYFNAGVSSEELLRHPEYMAISPEGLILRENRNSPFVRSVCYNSPFREHLRDMALEVLANYPVDGFFFDCLKVYPCVCPTCVKKMQAQGLDYTKLEDLVKFNSQSYAEFAKLLTEAIRKVKPDALIVFNCDDKELVCDEHSHFECECLPTSHWGYDYLPLYCRYNRALAGKDRQVLNMTGRFYKWGDFGGLRPQAALEYDMLYGIAQGLRPDIGGHFHPRGDMDMPVFDRIYDVYSKLQQYDDYTSGAVNNNDIALVFDKERSKTAPAKGLARMLDELKIQFDAVTEFCDWSKYKLLILADDLELTPQGMAKLQTHLDAGKKVLAIGKAALVNGKYPEAFPAEMVCDKPFDPAYFAPAGELAKGLQDMPLSIYAPAVGIKNKATGESLMKLVKPYMNAGWDGLRCNYYTAPEGVSEYDFIAANEQVICCAGNIGCGYLTRAPYQLRLLFGNMIDRLYGQRKVFCPKLPSFARAAVQQVADGEILHIIAYAAEARGMCVTMEDAATVCDLVIEFKVPEDATLEKVLLAPSDKELEFTLNGNTAIIKLDRMEGYALIKMIYQ
ncbi:MAG: hypothetical protein IKD10_11580 [Lentisphaeria bacterium]|nr:hypothetical protein [Lentisphaeria bacterium]